MSKKTKTAETAEEKATETAENLVIDAATAAEKATEAVTDPQSEATKETVGVLYKVVAPHGLNLRYDAGKEHRVLHVLPFGSVVEARGEAVDVNGSSWLPVQDGWVDATYLAPANAAD